MNWTGGQLRRHSARKGILSHTQRQNFAKSRQLVNDRASRQPVSFPDFLNLRDKQTVAEETDHAEEKQEESSSPLNLNQQEHRKHQFLQNPDWAALSLAQPLNIKFASAGEFERFGKRRKLNDADRKRLSVTDGRSVPHLYQPRLGARRFSTERDDSSLDHIQIKIDGLPARKPPDSNLRPELMLSSHSPHSMIMDKSAHMDSRIAAKNHQDSTFKSPWHGSSGLRSNPHASVEDSRSSSTIPETVVIQNGELTTPSRIAEWSRGVHKKGDHQTNPWRLERQTYASPIPAHLVPPRGYTTNDQAPVEQNYLGTALDTESRTISRSTSLVSTLLAYPTMNETPVSARQDNPGRQPQHRFTDTRSTDN